MVTTRGALVVLEGLDRAGKSSQCQLLYDKLHGMGIPVRLMKFPGSLLLGNFRWRSILSPTDRSTPTGSLIHNYLTGNAQQDDNSIHLLFSANRWESIGSIISDIDRGITVIVDRYCFSGAVYSAAKDNPNLPLHWAWAPEIGLPKPDITLFLQISPQDAARRGGFGAERYETTKMQFRVRELFGELFSKLGNQLVQTLDAGRAAEVVANDVSQPVLSCLNNMGTAGPLKKLGPLNA
jgi:dTMP kinase